MTLLANIIVASITWHSFRDPANRTLRPPGGLKLLRHLEREGLRPLLQLGLRLEPHDSPAPLPHQVDVVVELLGGEVPEQVQLRPVHLVHTRQRHASGRLLVDQRPQADLVLHDHERNLHLPAQGGHPQHQLDGAHVAGDKDQFGLLLLDEGGYVLEAELDLVGDLPGVGRGLARCLRGGGRLLDPLFLGGAGLGPVLGGEGVDGHGLILADGLGELAKRKRQGQAEIRGRRGRGDIRSASKGGQHMLYLSATRATNSLAKKENSNEWDTKSKRANTNIGHDTSLCISAFLT